MSGAATKRRRALVFFVSSAIVPGLVCACANVVGVRDLDVDPPATRTDASTVDRNDTSVQFNVDSGTDTAKTNDQGPTPDTGPTRKRVFITSSTSDGILGGISGGDKRCNDAAVKLGGLWVAWLSTGSINAIDRIKFDGPYDLLDKRNVVENKGQLTSGNINAPIEIMETGEKVPGDHVTVWTGTQTNGQFTTDCNGWSFNGITTFGAAGSFNAPHDGLWTDNLGPGAGFRNWGCQTTSHLYCFEQ